MAKRILIIEDEAPIRRLMALALEASGYEVATAEDGPKGLELFARSPGWCAVLLDQRMPGMEGLEVLPRLKAVDATVPVIMITAFASIDLAVDAMKLGATDFLRKPVTPDLLRAAVAAATSDRPQVRAVPHDRPVTPDLPDIEMLTMNGFRIRHEAPEPGSRAHRFRVFAGDTGEGTPVSVEIAPEAITRLESLTLRRFEPLCSFWEVQAENLLAAYLWSEQRVPTQPLVVRDVSRNDVDEAVAWPKDL
jgi:DNA-binding response OmpR family regulator